MLLSMIVEKWDAVLFFCYNCISNIKWYLFDKFRYGKITKKNKCLKNKHNGDVCYLVLNGPSMRKYDITSLKDEYVISTNYFYRSDLASEIIPDCICWQDAGVFRTGEGELIKEEIRQKYPEITKIFNIKGYVGDNDIYYTYNKHLPNIWGISNKLDNNCSAFSTVALYALNAAIYMGFKKIYVLGFDFEPGGFKHFVNLGENTDPSDPKLFDRKDDTCSEYWMYAKAHFEAYAINEFAKKNGCQIINLNTESYIRAFEFEKYDNYFDIKHFD